MKTAFFGSSRLSVIVLDEMKKKGLIPECIVTSPDKPQGRKLKITPNVVKVWALENQVKAYDDSPKLLVSELEKGDFDLFIVASYGRILPKSVIDIPKFKTLNIHPSLLPRYRGPSPLQTAILDDAKHTGVSIMILDEMMDHGPVIAQRAVDLAEWPIYEDFERDMAVIGADLLISTLPLWIAGKITPVAQEHDRATFTVKVTKSDAQIDLSAEPYLNFRKIQAYHEWPGAFFIFIHNSSKIRVKITSASFIDGQLIIKKVIPEGSKEMSYDDFRNGYARSR